MGTDARTKYTKMVIRSSFLELLSKSSVEKVTVVEICKKAGINRATFYRYYDNQYDLLAALEQEMLDEIKASTYEYRDNIEELTRTIFSRFYDQKDVWTILLSDHADLGFQSRIYAFFDSHFAKDESSKESVLRYRFLLYGYSGIFNDWVKNGMLEPPEEMAAYLNRFRHDLITNI